MLALFASAALAFAPAAYNPAAYAFAPCKQIACARSSAIVSSHVPVMLPSSALAAEGINAGLKESFSAALGPYADYAPIIGTVLFVGIQALSMTVFKPEPEPAAPEPEPEPASPADPEPTPEE